MEDNTKMLNSFIFCNNILCNKIYYEIFEKKCIEKLKENNINNHFDLTYFKQLINNTSKVQSYYDINEQSLFVDTKRKELFNNVYGKTNTCYNALNNFSIMCKIKYTKSWYECNTDLCMNELSQYKKSQIINLIEDGRVYAFWGKDLYNLIKKKLTNNYQMYLNHSV